MKYLKISLKYIILPLLILCISTVASLLVYRAYLQHKVRERTQITSTNGIESLEKIDLGGVGQWVSIRGWDKANPVLLYLHGGPGGAEIVLARHFDSCLERHFVVVRWDQRGAGKSYDPDIAPETMNFEQLVEDARELAEMLRTRFNAPKIYLVGHSWGSAIGACAASRYPESFYAFVGVGQMVESTEMERISYRFTLDRAIESSNPTALRELQAIGPPPYDNYDEMLTERKWLAAFGGLNHSDMGNLWLIGATSPDASLLDGLRYARGVSFSLKYMWDDFSSVNLAKQAPRIDVPVYFFLGRYDYNTPPAIAERYYQLLEAPKGKQIVWFENSAHMIPYEEPEKYCDVLVNKVVEETYESQH